MQPLWLLVVIHCTKSFALHYFLPSGADSFLLHVHGDGQECSSAACHMSNNKPQQPDIQLGEIRGEQQFPEKFLFADLRHRCLPNPTWRFLSLSSSSPTAVTPHSQTSAKSSPWDSPLSTYLPAAVAFPRNWSTHTRRSTSRHFTGVIRRRHISQVNVSSGMRRPRLIRSNVCSGKAQQKEMVLLRLVNGFAF